MNAFNYGFKKNYNAKLDDFIFQVQKKLYLVLFWTPNLLFSIQKQVWGIMVCIPYFLKKDPPSKLHLYPTWTGLDIDCMVYVLKQSTTAGLNVFCTNYFCGKSCQQILPNSRVNVNKESIRNLARKQVKKYLKKIYESLHKILNPNPNFWLPSSREQ